MSDFLKSCTKSVIEKISLCVVLQIVWIIEFHILAFFSAKDLIYSVTKEKIKVPPIIDIYSQMIMNWIDTYKEFIFFMGIIMIIVGISGTMFKHIPVLNKYKIIYTYSDFGLYAGCWILLIFYTYSIYMSMGKFFLTAPIIAYLLYLLIKKIKEWLEKQGIEFVE